MGQLQLGNYSIGYKRDSATDANPLEALHTFENEEARESDGAAVKRKGSNRWPDTAMASEPQQLHHFIDNSGQEQIFVVGGDNKLYRYSSSGAIGPNEIKNASATPDASLSMTAPPYPFLNLGDRVYFADDNDWYWSDQTNLVNEKCFVVGMDKYPADLVGIGNDAAALQYTPDTPLSTTQYELNSTTQQKIAQSFQWGVGLITGITIGNRPTVTTSNNHGLVTDQVVLINGVIGTMGTLLNGITFSITVLSATTLDLTGVDTTGTAYTSGGSAILQFAVYLADSMWCFGGRNGTPSGQVRVRLETDSSGDPSGTLINSDGDATWRHSTDFPPISSAMEFRRFRSQAVAQLTPGVDYWAVFETSKPYKSIFVAGAGGPNVVIARRETGDAYPLGSVKAFDGSNWNALVDDIFFIIGGGVIEGNPTATKNQIGDEYRYKLAWRRDNHNIESRPSEYFPQFGATKRSDINEDVGYTFDVSQNANYLRMENTVPAQADKIAIYRSESADTGTVTDTETYNLLARLDTTVEWVYDYVYEGFPSSPIQNENNFRLKDKDDSDAVPETLASFKRRLWAVIDGEDTLNYSQLLSSIGAQGFSGTPTPDAFPASNKLEIDSPGEIIQILQLAIDTDDGRKESLVTYFNDGIVNLNGGNAVTNPLAAPDINLNQVIHGIGLVGPKAVTQIGERHVFMSRSGVFAFTGSENLERLSHGFIQSIFDDISDANLALTIVKECDNGVWIAVDADDDGNLDTIFSLNLKTRLSHWRGFVYNFNIKDFVVRRSGVSMNQILVATDLSDNFIRQIEVSGIGSDMDINGATIDVIGTIETALIRASDDERRAFAESPILRDMMVHETQILATYAASTLATYTVRAIGLTNGTSDISTITPTNAANRREHRVGMRFRDEGFRIRVTQASKEQDIINELGIRWSTH